MGFFFGGQRKLPPPLKNQRVQSEGKAPVPTQKPASDLRFFLYVRVTVYTFPSFMRSSYSPVEHGRSSRTNEAFTKADRLIRTNPYGFSFSAMGEIESRSRYDPASCRSKT